MAGPAMPKLVPRLLHDAPRAECIQVLAGASSA